MIAIALFITSFCMIIGIFPVTFRSVQLSKESLLATNLGKQCLEYAKTLDYDSLPALNTANPPTIFLKNMVNGIGQELTFNYKYIVTEEIPNELSRVSVKVYWQYSSMTHYVTMDTKIARLK